jgi:predicted aldo/keto reductase-like oxidoreductase
MQYRIDQRSDNKLSVLGFGCMRFPRRVAVTDRDRTEKLILSAVERGVNYFDTAYLYGDSEVVLGDILHKNDLRKDIFLATKLPYQQCKRYEDFDRLFTAQLGRLKTDHIDYYLIHNISAATLWQNLCELGIEEWIAEKKASGQIRGIGFSFHGAQQEFLALLEAYDWDFCQIQYNYVDENYQAGRVGLEAACARGLPVIIMEPLLGGKLANGLPRAAQKCFEDADAGRTMASWALRWLWDQPGVTVVLSGMNSAEQLDDNIVTAEEAHPGMLSEEERAVFEPVTASFRASYKIPCTGCNYCMPCPNEVNIPGCFAAYNASYTVGFATAMTRYFTSTGLNHPEKNYSPERCVKCGLCEKKCPQHIEIIAGLAEVKKRMEPFWFGLLLVIVRRFGS